MPTTPQPLPDDAGSGEVPSDSTGHSRRVTLKEIATAAGVSVAAVSFALRNIPKISPAKRQQILRVAHDLGYRPDPELARLMAHLHDSRGTRSCGVLALLTCYRKPATLNESYLRNCLAAARSRAERLGYRLNEFSLADRELPGSRLQTILATRGIKGVLVAPLREGVERIDFDFSGVAAASMGFAMPAGTPMHSTRADEFTNMKLILQMLKDRGYRRIGFALEAELETRSAHRWTGAFLTEQLHDMPGAKIPPLIYPDWNKKHLKPWLAEYRPDVVISTEPFVYRWLQEFGYRVPKDIAFVSTSYAESLFEQPVSGIDERPAMIGSASVDLVVAHLQRNEFGVPAAAKNVELAGVWTGDFTAPFLTDPSPLPATK